MRLGGLTIFFAFFLQISINTTIASSEYSLNRKSNLDFLLPFKLCLSYEFDSAEVINQITASDNQEDLLIAYKSGKLVFLSSNSFEVLWSFDLGLKIYSNLVSDKENVFVVVVEGENYLLKRINKNTGLPEQQTIISSNKKLTDNASNNKLDGFLLKVVGDKIVGFSKNGYIFCFDIQERKVIWTKDLEKNISSLPFFASNKFYIATNNKTITKISIANGDIIGRNINTTSIASELAALLDGSVIYGDTNGNIFILDKLGKDLKWKLRFGAEITNIIETPFGLLVTSLDNFTYLIQVRNGKRLWKKRIGERISQKPLILDNYVIITNSARAEAAIIDLKTGKTVNRVNLPFENFFTGDTIFSNNQLIFSSLEGIFSYTTSPEDCRKTSL